MAGSTSKKVQIERFDREALSGFVNPATYLTENGIELLNLAGLVTEIPYGEAKAVLFVRDFGSADLRGLRRTFLSRPKLDGLWVRFVFRDRDILEGVLPNNLLQIEATGFHIIPAGPVDRLFVPKAALSSVQVLGVVGSPLHGRSRKKDTKDQIGLFEEEPG